MADKASRLVDELRLHFIDKNLFDKMEKMVTDTIDEKLSEPSARKVIKDLEKMAGDLGLDSTYSGVRISVLLGLVGYMAIKNVGPSYLYNNLKIGCFSAIMDGAEVFECPCLSCETRRMEASADVEKLMRKK